MLHEVDAVAGAVIDSKLGDTVADRLHIARVTERQPADADVDARLGHTIAQAGKPGCVGGRLTNLEHAQTVSHGIRYAKELRAQLNAVLTCVLGGASLALQGS